MQISKKLLWSAAALAPLAIAPVAIVASCATTVGPAQAIAEALHQGTNISFQSGKGTYNQAKLNDFEQNPSSFKNELTFNVPNQSLDNFEIEITKVQGSKNESDLANSTIRIDYKVKNKSQIDGKDDVGEYKGHKLTFTFSDSTSAPTQSAKDLANQANEAFDSKDLKLKDGLSLNGSDFALINGISNINDAKEWEKIDAKLLDLLFDGVVKGTDAIKLTIAKFNVAPKITKADQNITITLQLKYTDSGGSFTTKDFTFGTKYNDQISLDNVLTTLDIIFNAGWINYSKTSFNDGDVSAATFLTKDVTNFPTLQAKFLPTGFRVEIDSASWQDTVNTQDPKTKDIKFKFKVIKTSDGSQKVGDKTYTQQYKLS